MIRFLIGILASMLLAAAPPTPTNVKTMSWTGILASSRATDWTSAGAGTMSTGWTQCGSTIAGGTSGSPTSRTTVTNAITACGTNQYVLLGPGYFQGGICWTKSNVAVRGSGADQTFITNATQTCKYYSSVVTMYSSNMVNGYTGGTTYSWTAGFSKGSVQLTLSGTSAITANQSLVLLDQCNDGRSGSACTTGSPADTGNYFVAAEHPYITPGEDYVPWFRSYRSQQEIVVPTAVGSPAGTITIPYGLIAPQWRTGQTPQAWVIGTAIQNTGIENLSLTAPAGSNYGIILAGCYKCWVTGVRLNLTGVKNGIFPIQSANTTIANNYIYGDPSSSLDSYGIEIEGSTRGLIVNNIWQQNRSPIVYGPAMGEVIAYNFTVNNQPSAGGHWSFWNHNAGSAYQLYEGNIASGFANDNIHGTHNMITNFRNRYHGTNEDNPTNAGSGNAQPYADTAYTRYSNVVGNVLGVSGVQTKYETHEFYDPNIPDKIYITGAPNGGPYDPVSAATLMRWGNWDTVTNNTRWCTANATPIAACTASERAESATTYPALSSPSQTFPASFFLSSKPSWWDKSGLTSIPWPPIGPDVTGGTMPASSGTTTWTTHNVGGHANMNPALRCYKEVMNGPADGTGSILTFNATSCYP